MKPIVASLGLAALAGGLWLATLVVIGAFGWFVWPGRYEYRTVQDQTVLRIERTGGKVELWHPRQGGWVPYTRP